MENLMSILKAAVVGGIICMVGAFFAIIYSFTPLYAAGSYPVLLVLLSFALIGAVLWFTGLQQKLEEFAGMGAMLHFGALVAVIAQMTYATGKAKKSPIKGAATPLKEIYLKVIVIAFAFAAIVAVAVWAVNFYPSFNKSTPGTLWRDINYEWFGKKYPYNGGGIVFGAVNCAPYPPGGVLIQPGSLAPPNAVPPAQPGTLPQGIVAGVDYMVFLWAFGLGALISAVSQAIVMITAIKLPTFFLISICLGALGIPLGVTKLLVQKMGGGFQILIFDAGEAMTSTTYAFLAGTGGPEPWMPITSVVCMLILLGVIGIGAGWTKLAMEKKKQG